MDILFSFVLACFLEAIALTRHRTEHLYIVFQLLQKYRKHVQAIPGVQRESKNFGYQLHSSGLDFFFIISLT
jgi:hypothetical protein